MSNLVGVQQFSFTENITIPRTRSINKSFGEWFKTFNAAVA